MFPTLQKPNFECRHAALWCSLIVGASIGGVAAAQGTPAPGKAGGDQTLTATFTAADKDHDKALSPFEARRLPVAAEFPKYDANQDGYLTFEEYMAAARGARPAPAKVPARK